MNQISHSDESDFAAAPSDHRPDCRSLGRKISLQIENDDQIDFDDLGGEEEAVGEEVTRRSSRGVSQVSDEWEEGFALKCL